jgi:hypothetical protein
MREWQSISHVRWYCRYHIIIVPKYRKKVIFGTLRKSVGGILRQLCDQEGVELIEGHAFTSQEGALAPNITRGAPLGALHQTTRSAGGS